MTTTVRASVFVGVSVDGFMARSNDDLDFLPHGGGEEHGYQAFLASVDRLVLGRRTYDKVLTFEDWPYGAKPITVLSTRPIMPPRAPEADVGRMSASPKEILEKLGAQGVRHVYVDGGITIQQFLDAGLIQRLTITRVPVLIGTGIPLFGPLKRDITLRHIATHQYASGLVKSEYEVV